MVSRGDSKDCMPFNLLLLSKFTHTATQMILTHKIRKNSCLTFFLWIRMMLFSAKTRLHEHERARVEGMSERDTKKGRRMTNGRNREYYTEWQYHSVR